MTIKSINRNIKKHNKIISIFILILFISMFFIPCITFQQPINIDLNNGNILYDIEEIPASPYTLIKMNFTYYAFSITSIVFYIIAIILSFLVIIFVNKHYQINLLNLLPTLYFLVFSICSKGNIAIFNAGFYLSIILFVLILVHNFINLYPTILKVLSKSHNSHKPTKAERIDELEKQVAELKSKDNE